jgi:BON domain
MSVRRIFGIAAILGALSGLAVLARRLARPERPDAPDGGHSGLEYEGPRFGDANLEAATSFPEDATLVDRVESQLFRDDDVPKGDINVDAADGVVTLRGEVDAAMIEEIGVRAAAVEGVTRVENLLHPPGTPAPHAPPEP